MVVMFLRHLELLREDTDSLHCTVSYFICVYKRPNGWQENVPRSVITAFEFSCKVRFLLVWHFQPRQRFRRMWVSIFFQAQVKDGVVVLSAQKFRERILIFVTARKEDECGTRGFDEGYVTYIVNR